MLIAPPSASYTCGFALFCACCKASPRPTACPAVIWNIPPAASVAVYTEFMCSTTFVAPCSHTAAHAPPAISAGTATARISADPATIQCSAVADSRQYPIPIRAAPVASFVASRARFCATARAPSIPIVAAIWPSSAS